jgi:uncharacterized protein (TIGR03545 family)
MKKWIRWQGIVAFVALSAVIAGIWWLVVDGLIRYGIEKAGTKIVGAKVELDKADLTLFPLGLTLTRLQITNPEEPMTNAVEIARIAGTLDGLNLFRRKMIIEEMAVDGLRFGTSRKSSGALTQRPAQRTPAEAESGGSFKFPELSLRDPKAILAGENLQSLKLVEELKQDIEAQKQLWQKNLTELPDKAKLKDFQQRLEKLKSAGQGGIGGIVGGVGEAAKLQAELRKDLDRLKSAKQDLERSTTDLRRRYDEAVKAPGGDVKRLIEKYSLSSSGLANLSASLLGGKIGDWTRKALAWRAKLQPLVARSSDRKTKAEVVRPLRGKGVDVRFREHRPLPDFLVRLARISVELSAGSLSGQIRNITPDQPVLGAPLTFRFAGEKLQGLGAVVLDGEINRVDPAKASDRASLRIRDAHLNDYPVGDPGGIGLVLKQATVDLDVKATLSGQNLAATLSSQAKSVQMAMGKKADAGPIAAAVADALGGIKAFRVGAEVSGTPDRYNINLTSDLDQVLKNAVAGQVKTQLDRFQRDLQAAVMEKVKGPLGSLGADMGGLDSIGRELTDRLTAGEDILKAGAGGKPGFRLPF